MSSHQTSEGTVSDDLSSTSGSTSSSPEKKQLRKPMQATQQRLLNGTPPTPPDRNQNQFQSGTGTMGSPHQMSTLSVNAPEFVPKFSLQREVESTEQPADTGSAPQGSTHLSVSAPEFVPRITPYDTEDNLYEDFQRLVNIRPAHLNALPEGTSYPSLIDLFKNTLFTLTTQPGHLDDHMKPILEALTKGGSDEETLKVMVELLYEQGITEPNFRYTGAKVCKHLGQKLKESDIFIRFRKNLLNKFKQDFDRREEYVNTPDMVPRLCGLTMFLGELFLNMEAQRQDGTMEKMIILRKALRDLILTLLAHPSEPTVICATKCLKLVGACLAETNYQEAASSEGGFDEVFAIIHKLESMTELGATCMCLIKSVINLKDTVWGKQLDLSPPRPTMSPAAIGGNFPYTNEPVFFNQFGQPITREEAGFFDAAEEYDFQLEAEAFYNGQLEPEDYEQWSHDPGSYDYAYGAPEQYGVNYMPELNEEEEAAFEEFLRYQHH